MESFTINSYLTLKLENRRTIIHINGKRFIHCKKLLFNFKIEDLKKINKMDKFENLIEYSKDKDQSNTSNFEVTPKQEFWAHCSNLQTWYDNHYEPDLIHYNLSFPLLRELFEAGDQTAGRVFKEHIAKKYESGNPTVRNFLINESYLSYLSKEMFWTTINLDVEEEQKLMLQELEKKINRRLVLLNEFKVLINEVPGFILRKRKVVGLVLYECGLERVPPIIGKLKTLEKLDLSWNKIEQVSDVIGSLILLKELRLTHNNIEEISESIGNLVSLQILDLSGNKLEKVPIFMKYLKSLDLLNLNENKLKEIPKSILYISSLTRLLVGNNNLMELPESIGNHLKNVKVLYAINNNIKIIPSSLSKLSFLEFLDLSVNKLDKLPDNIYKLESLKTLYLGNNKIESLPETIGSLKSIQSIDIVENPLHSLPSSFTKKFINKVLVMTSEQLKGLNRC